MKIILDVIIPDDVVLVWDMKLGEGKVHWNCLAVLDDSYRDSHKILDGVSPRNPRFVLKI